MPSVSKWLFAVLSMVSIFFTPALAAQLVVVEDNRCQPCARFEGSVGRYYNSTPQGRKAPLRRVNVAYKVPADLASLPIHGPIRGTPTFVLIDHGRAVGMFDGFSSSAVFWQKIDGLLQQVNAVE